MRAGKNKNQVYLCTALIYLINGFSGTFECKCKLYVSKTYAQIQQSYS